MTIIEYLENTAFATKQLFNLLEELVEKRNKLINLKGTAPIHLQNAQTFDAFSKQVKMNGNIEESYDFLKRAFEKYEKHKTALSTIREIEDYYSDKILIANGPIQVIAQAILQIAKQGLSSTYHTNLRSIRSVLTKTPRSILDANNVSIKIHQNGTPSINDITILDAIWQGRNQSIHYESTVFQDVRDVFEPLKSSYSSLEGYDSKENKAYEVVSKVLKWNLYDDYRLDMEEII
ncbi:hypothetical protein CN689_08740 [Peribacillus butanolivorans]|uniref:Uncharacterized protein n=1 Tax=Peribacillus butanolivorans TaxID=421767 RepID=A0AAX0S4Q2_9BACI|nr:hypothetical protein [Peribacillus butanolivorans]PEJ34220.1 hypothetical protein CN689_08740 [Peribacillus butanolivorans]